MEKRRPNKREEEGTRREDQGKTGEERKPCSCTYTGNRNELAWDPVSEKFMALRLLGRVMPSFLFGAVLRAFVTVHYHRRSLEPDSDIRNEGMDAQRG